MDKDVDALRQELRQEMQSHSEAIERRLDEGDRRFRELITATEANTVAVSKLVQETQGVVSLYRDVEGVYRFGKTAQQFGVWLIKWPVIGAGIFTMYLWLKENFPS